MDILLKKIIRDYNYHQETLSDIKEISDKAEVEFRESLQKSDPEAAKALVGDGKTEEKKKEEKEAEDHGDKGFKKIYRKITMQCHPDRVGEDDEMLVIYQMAVEANETYDWGLLLKVAFMLDIELDLEELSTENLENVESNIKRLKGQIQKYENSMAYKWYLMKDLGAKEKFMLSCAQVFKKSLEGKS